MSLARSRVLASAPTRVAIFALDGADWDLITELADECTVFCNGRSVATYAAGTKTGTEVIDHVEESEYGRFGWAVDPEGNRLELWQPAPGK